MLDTIITQCGVVCGVQQNTRKSDRASEKMPGVNDALRELALNDTLITRQIFMMLQVTV